MAKLTAGLVAAACIGLVAGCGGGSDSPPASPETASAAGIWSGTMHSNVTGQDLHLAGVSVASGDARFTVQESCAQIVVRIGVSGSAVTGSGTAYASGFCNGAPLTRVFLDGTRAADASISGVVSAKSALSGRYAAGGDNGTFSLTYSNLYDRPSSLSTLAGSYKGVTFAGQFVGAIDDNANITGSDSGGKYNGKVHIIDPAHNVYGVSIIYAPTVGSSVAYDGLMVDSSPTVFGGLLAVQTTNSFSLGSGVVQKQ